MRNLSPRLKAGFVLSAAGGFIMLLATVAGGTAQAETCGTVPCSATAAPTPTPEATLTPVPWCPIGHLCSPVVCNEDGCIGTPISSNPQLWLPSVQLGPALFYVRADQLDSEFCRVVVEYDGLCVVN